MLITAHPAALGGSRGLPGPEEGRRLCGCLCGAGKWGGTLSPQPTPGLPVQPREGQCWLCPMAGAPAGVAGGLPQWGQGRSAGGCPGGGWLAGGLRPQGLSAPQPRATLVEASAAFRFRGFCKDELSHPERGRCLHAAPGPAPSLLLTTCTPVLTR